MVRSIFFFAQWFIARRRTWLRILTWITRFGYWLFILYGLLEWFRPRPIAEQIKRRKTLVYCLFSVILGSSVSWVIGKIWHRPRPFACGDAAALAVCFAVIFKKHRGIFDGGLGVPKVDAVFGEVRQPLGFVPFKIHIMSVCTDCHPGKEAKA